MKPELVDPITALADYFSGQEVGHASVCLELTGPHLRSAERFFAVRRAFGIEGYADRLTCEKKIMNVLKEQL